MDLKQEPSVIYKKIVWVIGNTKVMTLQAPWERKLSTEPGIYPAVLNPGIYPLKFVYRTGRQVQRVFYEGIS